MQVSDSRSAVAAAARPWRRAIGAAFTVFGSLVLLGPGWVPLLHTSDALDVPARWLSKAAEHPARVAFAALLAVLALPCRHGSGTAIGKPDEASDDPPVTAREPPIAAAGRPHWTARLQSAFEVLGTSCATSFADVSIAPKLSGRRRFGPRPPVGTLARFRRHPPRRTPVHRPCVLRDRAPVPTRTSGQGLP